MAGNLLTTVNKNVEGVSPGSRCGKKCIDSVFVTPFAITGEIYINSNDILGCSDVEIKLLSTLMISLNFISGKE
jgi:hypothetical protein